FHVDSKGRLKTQAYDPTPGTEDVSVMRLDWIGPHRCRHYALLLEHPPKQKTYRGLSVLLASEIRAAGQNVLDSRELFRGHADIKMGIVLPRNGDPGDPVQIKRLRDRAKKLSQVA